MKFGKEDSAGPVISELYKRLTGIQYGEIEDKYNWLFEVK
jgi:branched-chain amino acid aminotransferase